MRVLITGATGLVGNELVSLLLNRGIQINYLTTSKSKIRKEDSYAGFYWNPEKGVIDEDCINGVDVIIHLAGAPIAKRWTESYKKEILNSRTTTTNMLYNLLKSKENNVHQFISASAIGIYPDSMDEVYSEDNTAVDNSFVGKVVEKWEEVVDKIKELKIRVAKIRIGLVLSAKGGMLAELAKPVSYGVGSAFGSGKQIQSWIHIEDLVEIFFYVLNNEMEGVFNAVAPYPVSQNDLVKCVAKVLKKPYFMPNVPKFVMKMMLGDMSMLMFTSQNVSAKKIIATGYQFKFLSLEKAIANELVK
ncbi:TIGR01777 family oxidoreductase [Flavobacterium rakeshii]|uniref:TIGR01777 family oxidoreductase n=1 Tax=Flavobacterium rakeshii TaxID=1038845 RepID=UPI002E7BAD69|nr:TIGR01777 family oxidoreductase [Flavobacterium rakeshii]MEE1897047.1 TIGR01777 family oxidoreductase [Flavobacterium rakeshii]